MADNMDALTLESSRSTRISLEAIREGDAGLNPHRQSMLNRVPEIGDSATFKHESLELIDLAYLTAKTGHEFAILRGKDLDILFHGDSRHCYEKASIKAQHSRGCFHPLLSQRISGQAGIGTCQPSLSSFLK